MEEFKEMTIDMREKIEDLIIKAEFLTIASINDEGYPYPCVMSLLNPSCLNEVYFSTGTTSSKTGHFKKNPKAGMTIQNGPDSVVMTGMVNIVEDMDMKMKYWQDWMINHFPKGPTDTAYCLIRFVPHQAVVWIDNFFERYCVESESV